MTYIAGVSPEFERGRSDDREELRLRLTDAPAEYLAGALENPSLGIEDVPVLLRNRRSTAEIVARIARNRTWMQARDVKVAFVTHPRAVPVVARQVLPHLFWRDLADVASDLRLSPLVRRDAERMIARRLPDLSVGERITLARRGSRGIIESLRDDAEGLVLRAIAGNPRATEDDLTRILQRPALPRDFLGWLCERSTWGQRRALRIRLVRHPRTPVPSALRLMAGLSRRDLEDLSGDESAPRLIRVAAGRTASAQASFG